MSTPANGTDCSSIQPNITDLTFYSNSFANSSHGLIPKSNDGAGNSSVPPMQNFLQDQMEMVKTRFQNPYQENNPAMNASCFYQQGCHYASSSVTSTPATPSTSKRGSSASSPFPKRQNPSRHRTRFTNTQLKRLEEEFEKDDSVTATRVRELGAKLELKETVVRIWFKNRRAMQRKKNSETRPFSQLNYMF